jgi:hypothetical protein
LRNSVPIEQVFSTHTLWNWENNRCDKLNVVKHVRHDRRSRKRNNNKLVQLPQFLDLKCQILIFALIFCNCGLYFVGQWNCYIENTPSLFGLSINVMFCLLTGNDPSRICSCHFTVRPAAHICNMGIIIIIILL